MNLSVSRWSPESVLRWRCNVQGCIEPVEQRHPEKALAWLHSPEAACAILRFCCVDQGTWFSFCRRCRRCRAWPFPGTYDSPAFTNPQYFGMSNEGNSLHCPPYSDFPLFVNSFLACRWALLKNVFMCLHSHDLLLMAPCTAVAQAQTSTVLVQSLDSRL